MYKRNKLRLDTIRQQHVLFEILECGEDWPPCTPPPLRSTNRHIIIMSYKYKKTAVYTHC